MESVNNGKLSENIKIIDLRNAPSRAQRMLKFKDILFQTVRPYQKNNFLFLINRNKQSYVSSTGYAQLRTKSIANTFFTYYLLHTESFVKKVLSLSTGSNYPAINSKDLSKIKIYLPSLDEQKNIGILLFKIDDKIRFLEQNLHICQKFKKGLLQQIFTQKLQFANFDNKWSTSKIGDLFSERVEKNYSNLELLSVTIDHGVMKRTEIESKDNSSSDKSNYKRVMPQDIVYNSMRMWQGASGISEFEGIVSPAYTILIPNEDVYSKFFSYMFKTHNMLNQFKKYSQGLTSDTWNLKYPLISEITVYHPSKNEQIIIVTFLEEIDKKIDLIQLQIEKMEEFKKGLLQQMFICKINFIIIRK